MISAASGSFREFGGSKLEWRELGGSRPRQSGLGGTRLGWREFVGSSLRSAEYDAASGGQTWFQDLEERGS